MQKKKKITIGIIALTGGDDVICCDGWASNGREIRSIPNELTLLAFPKQNKFLLRTFCKRFGSA